MFGKGQRKGLALLIVGSLLVAGSAYLIYQEQQRVLPPALVLQQTAPEANTQPVHLELINAGVSVKVEPGYLQNGRWSVVPDAANYLVSSSLPDEGGNILIYGHNKKEVLANLKQAEIGEVVELTSEDGQKRQYEIVKRYVTGPNDTSPLEERMEETLTIYTCTGFLDTKRLVIEGQLITPSDDTSEPDVVQGT